VTAQVWLPTHLRSYTAGVAVVQADGRTLGEVLAHLDRRYPGFLVRVVDEQDRIRPHIKCFVAGEQAQDLTVAVTGDVQLVAALSGG